MASARIFCAAVIALFLLFLETRADGETCKTGYRQLSYCKNGCCETNYFYDVCCEDNKEYSSNTGLVVGGVLASIGGVFVVVALVGVICCCCSAAKGRGGSARAVHPYPAAARYDGATVHIFYTAGSAGQPLVPGAQPLQPPAYKREPDPGPPSYSSLGRHPTLTPLGGSGSGSGAPGIATNATAPTRATPTLASGLTAVDDPPFPAEDERVISPPPPYMEPTVGGGPIMAPQSTRYPH